MLASAILLCVGLASTAVGFHQLSEFQSTLGDGVALSLWFFGITLIGAGALCPFSRSVSGALCGFILAGLSIMNPIRSIGTNANETFNSVAAELDTQQDAATRRSDVAASVRAQ
jgi:hypothetical protein